MSLRIRATTYRNEAGYMVTGRDPRGRRVRLFTKTLAGAEHLRDVVRSGDAMTMADLFAFEPMQEGES